MFRMGGCWNLSIKLLFPFTLIHVLCASCFLFHSPVTPVQTLIFFSSYLSNLITGYLYCLTAPIHRQLLFSSSFMLSLIDQGEKKLPRGFGFLRSLITDLLLKPVAVRYGFFIGLCFLSLCFLLWCFSIFLSYGFSFSTNSYEIDLSCYLWLIKVRRSCLVALDS